jgi:colanic acid/amylovoran biosynthesis glycosyltransferase
MLSPGCYGYALSHDPFFSVTQYRLFAAAMLRETAESKEFVLPSAVPSRRVRMRLLYVTASFPFGHGEGFLVEELRELERQGHEVTVVPLLPRGPVVHADARTFLPRTRAAPLVSRVIVRSALRQVVGAPRRTLSALALLTASRTPRILLKNLAVFPKALWAAALTEAVGAEHLHAHWGGTSGTLGLVAARVADVPWSLTVHRWDIREDNLLRRKALSASFVRAISGDGLRDLRRVAGASAGWTLLLHMGVALPERRAPLPVDEQLHVLVPANLLEVKGHRHLVDALALLRDRGVRVTADLAGTGPLRGELAARIDRLGLGADCSLIGQLSHEELLQQLEAGRWGAVVLPSVVTSSGEKEGIPVAFLEAMSFGVPVVGTAAGGVPELLADGAGLLVPPADARALADALERLAQDGELRARLAVAGRERVERDFSVESVVAELTRLFGQARNAAPGRPARSRAGS